MHRTNRKLIIAAFCCFSITCLTATLLLSRYLPRTDAQSVVVELPSMVGTSYAEGDERLPPSLYEVILDYRTDPASTPGTVLAQHPSASSERRVIPDHARCTVHLTLSTGAATVTLPHLVGKSARESELLLRGAGLSVRIRTVTRDDLSPGQIVDSEPKQGSTLHEGETVTLIVSEATTKSTVRVPSVCGSDVVQANRALALRGLKPGEPTLAPSAEPRGTVISQQPLAGTLVPSGTRAALSVSDGSLAVEYEDEYEYEDEAERGDESPAPYINESNQAVGDE